MVLNHSFGQSPFVQLYLDHYGSEEIFMELPNPWFNASSPNQSYKWGADFNHESPSTQKLVDRVTSYWMTEYKVDGFRFDFTKGFTNTPGDGGAYDAPRIAILKRMADRIWETNSNAYVILEHLAVNSEETALSNYGMMLWGNINYNYCEASMGYVSTSDFSGISYKSRGWANPNLVGYMESHDEERMMYRNITYGNSTNTSYNVKYIPIGLARNELAALFFLAVPGPKMIWQFGELGYDISIDQNGRVGRKPIHWDYMQDYDRRHLLSTYSQLINLKKEYPVFETSDFWISFYGSKKWIKLIGSDMDAVAMGNFDVQNATYTLDFPNSGRWYEYFAQDSVDLATTSFTAPFNPGEYRLYTTKRIIKKDIFLGIDSKPVLNTNTEFDVFPNPSNGLFSVNVNLNNHQKVNISIYSIIGQKVFNSDYNNLSMGINTFDIQLPSSITQGIYICRIMSGNTIRSKKIIVE